MSNSTVFKTVLLRNLFQISSDEAETYAIAENHKSNDGKLFLVRFYHYFVSYGLRYVTLNTFTSLAREGQLNYKHSVNITK
jgi:hypothetical protein